MYILPVPFSIPALRRSLQVINKSKFLALGGSSEQMVTEAKVLDQLRHPNIISIRAVYETDKFLVMALELYVLCLILLSPQLRVLDV